MSSKDYVIIKDGELVHFKYIKREKVNGEWRYYYDKGSIGRSIKKAVGIDARNAYRSARDAAVAAENAHKEAYAAKRKEAAEATAAAKKLEDVKNAKNDGPEYESPAMKLARSKLAKEEATRSAKEAANEYATQAAEAAEANKKNAEAAKKSVEAQKKAQEALKKYYKTPLGSLKFLSDKGKELLYKIF